MGDHPELSATKLRILEMIKAAGAGRVSDLAGELDLTPAAIRQHLGGLEGAGYVESRSVRLGASSGRGRPPQEWILTSSADRFFPDGHSALARELIHTVRLTMGESSLNELLEARSRDQVDAFRARLNGSDGEASDLESRVRALAAMRTEEGYMADVLIEDDGSFMLVELHCPICDTARACSQLCTSELSMFRTALGEDVDVERTEHLLSGGARCAYRIRPSTTS